MKSETHVIYLVFRNPQTPWYAKLLAGMVAAYAFSPIDLIPDFIPILGYLDDLLLVPLGILLVRKLIPAEIMAVCREQARTQINNEKPTNWWVGALIVLTWVGLAAAGVMWLARLLD